MPETFNQAFVAAAGALRQAGVETAELDARLLLCHAAGLSHEAMIARASERLEADSAARLEQALARRLEREPVSRILGAREFYGRQFAVGPGALDPRPDTETLIEAALAIADRRGGRNRPLSLLDLGTGTGCILLTLLAELPQAHGIGTDIGQDALTLAARNAERLGVAQRASFVAADWLDGIDGKFDLILSNPPYLARDELAALAEDVARYDPHVALDGGADGLEAYRRIAARAPHHLGENGALIVEIGASQAEAVAAIFSAAGLEIAALHHDLGGRPRAIAAVA